METGKPTLLRVHVALPFSDPWDLIDHAACAEELRFAWHDGQNNLRLAGQGQYTRIPWFSDSEFQQVRDLSNRWSEKCRDAALVEDGPLWEQAPLFLGGLAFDKKTGANTEDWGNWPVGELWIPALLAYQKRDEPGQSGLIIHIEVQQNTSIESVMASVQERLHALPGLKQPSSQKREITWNPVETSAGWTQRVNAARQAISSTPLEKVVLCRSVKGTSPNQPFSAMGSLKRLQLQHTNAYSFAIEREDGSAFVGATPETLVRVHGGHLETHALAGTAARGNTPEEDRALAGALIECDKNREEHALVVEAIERHLTPYCERLVVQAEPQIVALPQLQHLCSEVRGSLEPGAHVLDIVHALHPTPAVSGWPTDEAKSWLEEHEAMQRGWYAGAIGWFNRQGDGTFAVSIRSALLQGNTAIAYAGAGIVPDSNPDAEWTETQWKLTTVQQALVLKDGVL